MLADIITIGDEILIGQILDTNSAYIAGELQLIGFRTRRILTVSDESAAIRAALDESVGKVKLVVMTGGLGPTRDDITKITLRDYFGGEFREDRLSMTYIRKLCEQRNLPLTERNRFQAMVPESCTTLRNRAGSAPGMLFRKSDTLIVSLPGVSFEMKSILDQELIPLLKQELHLPVRLQKTILCCGIPESVAADQLSAFEDALPAQTGLAYLPSPGILRLRVSVEGEEEQGVRKTQEKLTAEVTRILGNECVFGYDDDSLESVIGGLLRERGKTLAVAESCTGGNISHLITSVPGSSDYLLGSVVAYSNRVKEEVLKVSHVDIEEQGAVSGQVVGQMATGIRELTGADYAIATSGIAGPAGGSAEKPVGTTWIAVATPKELVTHKFLFGDNRDRNIVRASVAALNLLRNIILKER